jgi:hypothetical protein
MFRAIVDKAARSVVLGWCVLMVSTVPAMAQGRPAPGPNQAFLYEMDEQAVLLNASGNVLVPDPSGQSPTGLVDSKTGRPDMPVIRRATSQLQGVAMLGSLLCPILAEVTVASNECTVMATGTDDVELVLDPASGQLVPTRGAVWGTYAVLVQLDNGVDSPEFPVQTGTFHGVINFQPPWPLGFVSDGVFTIDGVADKWWPFDAVFRQPFRDSEERHAGPRRGNAVKSSRTGASARTDAAYYLLDDGKWQQLRADERAVGWPTVRFEITF